jgi:hypothetical protein
MNRRSILTAIMLFVVVAGGFVAGRASAAQPHMAAALDHLRLAKRSLESATADKGGHREKAIRLVNDAIAETELGMEVARH